MARAFGKAGSEFEKAKIEAKRELQQLKNPLDVGREKLEEVAGSLGIDPANKNDEELRAAIKVELNKTK